MKLWQRNLLLILFSWSLLFLWACGGEPPPQEQGAAACQDGLDNDKDGDIDCEDDGCKGYTFCQKQGESTPAACQDKKDNDGDGKVDCDDDDCKGFTFCQNGENTSTACQDKKDNDGDKKIDCDDEDCQGFTFCQKQGESTPAACQDKKDNDGDGKVDCDDDDCQGFTFCQKLTESTPALCQDKKDNDGDGKVDCDDDDCAGFYFCAKVESTSAACQDKKDNDGDGKVDCDDDDCAGFYFCAKVESTSAACQDKKDNDGDGKVDCDDTDCQGFTFCQKVENTPAACQDKKDNDGDGKIDCGDEDCKGFTFCQQLENTAAFCHDGKDNDGDGKVDCDDDDCKAFYFCQKSENTVTLCTDKKDNDGDGKVDCDDVDCKGFTFCQKVENTAVFCQDKKDNDGDGKVDCDDDDCKGFFFCQKAENTVTLCQDKKDNDGDGKVDCDDVDCSGFFFCQKVENTSALCQDKKDNDGDGKVDCDDSDCAGFFFCQKLENTSALCMDKKDNDGDGKVDCDDPDCAGFYFCIKSESTPADCRDKKDNDGDGKVDCDDPDCQGYYFCAKSEDTMLTCQDKKDNDGDGKVDCADSDCQIFTFCQKGAESSFTQCRDKVDNDADGKVDCQDPDCWHWHFCAHYSGYPVTDAWGATWDGLARAAATWTDAKLDCESKGGRLPTATELYRNNVRSGGSAIGNAQSTEYLWTLIKNYRNQRVALRLSDGAVNSYSESSKVQYRCIWPPKNPKKGFNALRCHGKPGQTCQKLDEIYNIDTWDRPALDYAAAANECAFYSASIPTLSHWSRAIHNGLMSDNNEWRWIAKANYWYRNGFGMAILRWRGRGSERWYFDNSTFGSVSYPYSSRRFRCVGLAQVDQYKLPKVTSCAGQCFTVKATGFPFIIDGTDRGASNYKTAFAACRSLGGDLPTVSEWTEAIHQGLANGSNNWLWTSDPLYWYRGGYGYAIIRWAGKGTEYWHYQYSSYGTNSYATNSRPYRCIWRMKRPAWPTCKKGEIIVKSGGKLTCKAGGQGSSGGKALLQKMDSWGNAWDGLERGQQTYDNAVKVCQSFGGRLPTATELYSVRAGNPHIAIGSTSNNNYLWTQTPSYQHNYHVALRLSNGAATSYPNSSSRPYRCIWPAKRNEILHGSNCYGPPGSECFKTSEGLFTDSYDRPAIDVVAAAYDCKFSGGRLLQLRDFTRLIYQGMPNGTNSWLWIIHPMYWYRGGYGYALVRWSGVGTPSWAYTNPYSSLDWWNRYHHFRCVYSPFIQ